MSSAIVYAVLAMASYGVSDFIYKQAAAAGIRADHLLLGQAWFFGPLVTSYALATRNLVLEPAALWGSLAGLFAFIGFYFFTRSLAAGAVSTNAAIFRLNFIVTAAFAVFLLGEPLTLAKVLGLMLALGATWLLVGARTGPRRGSDDLRGTSLIEVAIATLAFGTSNFFHTVGLRHGAAPETLAVAQAALFVPLATAVVYLKDRRLPPQVRTFRYGAIAALVLLAATVLMLRSVARGEASVMVPIAQMGFIVAALLGVFVLGERITPRKAIGLACAVAALGVLAAG
jgi:drug/metabolite transporter (DMT)-like permease